MKKLIYILFIVSLLSLSSCSAIVEATYGTTHAIIDNQLGYPNYYSNSIYYYRTPYYYPRNSHVNQYYYNVNRYKLNNYKSKAYIRKKFKRRKTSHSTTRRRN